MICVGPALCFAVAGGGEVGGGTLVDASAVCNSGHDGVIAGNWLLVTGIAGNWYERCS